MTIVWWIYIHFPVCRNISIYLRQMPFGHKTLHIVGLYRSPPSTLLNTEVFHLWKEFPLYTPEKFPTQKPIKRGGLIRLEEIGRGGEVGGAAKLPLKLCFKAGPCTTNNEDSYQDMRVLLALFGVLIDHLIESQSCDVIYACKYMQNLHKLSWFSTQVIHCAFNRQQS